MHFCCLQMHETASHISINVIILTVSMATKLADFIASNRLGHISRKFSLCTSMTGTVPGSPIIDVSKNTKIVYYTYSTSCEIIHKSELIISIVSELHNNCGYTLYLHSCAIHVSCHDKNIYNLSSNKLKKLEF